MGSYFANLFVKSKDINILTEKISEYYASRGIISCDNENADIEISLFSPENSEWTSVCSDAFMHTDILDLANPLSVAANADVISVACFDSDYLFLNLINPADSTNAWLNIGKSYEIKAPHRSNITAWKNKVRNFESFKLAAKEKYVCAEEFFFSSAENLGLSPEQIDLYEFPESCIKLYFTAPQKEGGNPTKFTLPTYNLNPCQIGKHDCCSFYNTGSSSRGIAVVFTGNYAENDEITFDRTAIRTVSEKPLSPFVSTPITLKKIKLTNGQSAYYWEDPKFKIPECVSTDLPPMVYQKKVFSREIIVDFVPKGNPRKVLDICVTLIPLSNPINGQSSWNVWQGHYNSKLEFIEEQNKDNKELEQYGAPVVYYNPEDYDLE